MNEWTILTDGQGGLLGVTQLPMSKPYVPAVIELHGDYLCWSGPSPSEAMGHSEMHIFPSPHVNVQVAKDVPQYGLANLPVEADFTGALDRFAGLRIGQDVLRFARRYGVLEFCQHGLPAAHNPRFLSVPLFGLIQYPSLWKPAEGGIEQKPGFLIVDQGERPWCEGTRSEAIEGWLFWSRMAAAILNVAAALAKNHSTQRVDWETIITEESDERSLLIDSLLARRWIAGVYLEGAVNRWLHLANVRLSLSWPIGGNCSELRGRVRSKATVPYLARRSRQVVEA